MNIYDITTNSMTYGQEITRVYGSSSADAALETFMRANPYMPRSIVTSVDEVTV